jgi:tRNA dimethylallyltransferase
VGPTAIGKTSIAIQLAEHFKTEIVSADSRQFYKELAIGTAKPSALELKTVKHHFIDSLSIHEDYNSGQFETDAIACLQKIFMNHDLALLVGGSGLFVNAVCHGMDQLPESDPDLRAELDTLLNEKGIKALQKKLSDLDPEYFRTVDQLNPHRLIRAIEVCMLTGIKYSELRKRQGKERDFSIVKIGLDEDREKVYERINRRVDVMMQNGLAEEAKKYFSQRHLNSLQTVGYRELFDFLEGKISFHKAVELIKRNTRRYAKRQLTWFRKDKEITWFQPDQISEIIRLLEQKV